MRKSLNISLLWFKTIIPTWAYGGTVDTPVLGTGVARRESSNLSKPTRKVTILELIALLVSKFLIKICCSECCIEDKMLQSRKGMYREMATSRTSVSLRNYPPNSYVPTTAYFVAIPTTFF